MYAKEDPRYSYYILHMVSRDFYILLSNAIFFTLVPTRFLSIFNTLTDTLVIYDRTTRFLLWHHSGHRWPERLNFLQL